MRNIILRVVRRKKEEQGDKKIEIMREFNFKELLKTNQPR